MDKVRFYFTDRDGHLLEVGFIHGTSENFLEISKDCSYPFYVTVTQSLVHKESITAWTSLSESGMEDLICSLQDALNLVRQSKNTPKTI